MSALTTRIEDLAFALVAWVVGICCEDVTIGLLIGHRRWFGDEDFLAGCVQVGVIKVDVFACVGRATAAASAALVATVIAFAAGCRGYVLASDVGVAR